MDNNHDKSNAPARGFPRFARMAGWTLLVLGVLVTLGAAGWVNRIRHTPEGVGITPSMIYQFVVLNSFAYFILPGVLAFSLIQLFRWIEDVDYQPTWLLLRSHRILYFWAGLQLVHLIFYLIDFPDTKPILENPGEWFAHFALLNLVPRVMRLLILLGAAEALKRVLAAIEESRTLV